jgi:hypothetical protein
MNHEQIELAKLAWVALLQLTVGFLFGAIIF